MAHIYLAAPWTCKAQARNFAAKLEKAGHDITERWWEHVEVDGYPSLDIPEDDYNELGLQSDRDLAGIDDADAVVVMQLAKSEGKAVETGYAICLEKPICVLCPDGLAGNLFHFHSAVKVLASEPEVLLWLSTL